MENFEAKDAWLVVDGKKVMNLNINDEQFYGLGDLAIKKKGIKSMKYVKYGHGKWQPVGWKANFDMNGILKLTDVIEKQLRKVYEKELIK